MSAAELVRWIRDSVAPQRAAWLEGVVAELGRGGPRVLAAFVGARRKLGQAKLAAPAGATLPGADEPVAVAGWRTDRAGRVALLVALAEADPAAVADAVTTLYREGDSSEKAAVIAALPLLPDPGRFVDLARDAGRTSETDLFSALAIGNPFPAHHYDDDEFARMVMKAAFVAAPIDRIVGLDRRATPELARMGMDYIDEQQSAGRRFPPELWLAIAPAPPPGAVARLIGYLEHSVAEERLGAARGLARAGDRRALSFLVSRAERETDAAVSEAISRALELLAAEDISS